MNLSSIFVFSMIGAELTRGFGSLLGSSLYDIREAKKQHEYNKHPHAKRFRKRPLLSILILAENAEDCIEDTLKSIAKSSYRKFEIIIINNGSTDDSAKTVRTFIKSHKKLTIRLTSKRKPADEPAALTFGTRKVKGKLVLTIRAGSRLDREALKHIVRHAAFEADHLLIQQRVMPKATILSGLERFESLASDRSQKALLLPPSSLIGTVRPLGKGKSSKLKTTPTHYAHNVISYSPSSNWDRYLGSRFGAQLQRFDASGSLSGVKRYVGIGREMLKILEPILAGYFLYLALVRNTPQLYGIAWVAVSAYLGFLAWTDEHASIRQKISLSLLLPVIFNLLVLISIMQLLAGLYYLGLKELQLIQRLSSDRRRKAKPAKSPSFAG